MSMQASFVVPPGQSPPFAIVTETDHRAWILISAAFGLCCSLLFGGFRLLVRLTIAHGFGVDDALLGVGTIFGIVQSVLILEACSNGFGKTIKHVPEESHAKVFELYYTGMLFFIIVVGLSKLSVACFLLRIVVSRTQRQIIYSLTGFISLWTFASSVAVGLQCNYSHPWSIAGERCSGSLLRWQIIAAFDVATEICLIGGSLMLVWGLQASIWTKAGVVTMFTYRLPMIIPIAFRLAKFHPTGRSVDPFLVDSLFSVFTQVEMNYSLVSATIVALRPFATNMNTRFGGLGEGETSYGYGRSNEDNSKFGPLKDAIQMSTMAGPAHKKIVNQEHHDDAAFTSANVNGESPDYNLGLRASSTNTLSNVDSGQSATKGSAYIAHHTGKDLGDTISVSTNNSQQLIIKKKVSEE